MTISLESLMTGRSHERFNLHQRYINPQFAKVLKTIGYDRIYSRAEGLYLYDNFGESYLDFLSGYGVFAAGRNHPSIKKALKEFLEFDTANMVQMDTPLFSGLLAEALIQKVNQSHINTVYFTNSGTESIESAIKFARCYTQKPRILFLNHAFHGLSTGSLALNGSLEFRDGFGELLGGCCSVEMNQIDQLEDELKKGDVAGFFFEPIQGKGVYVPLENYLLEAQELCNKYKALFVADEIQTGLGRTGKFLAHEHWGLSPDIICLSKALSAGMVPIGAVLTKRDIYNKVYSRMDRCVVHSSTFGQNDMAMVCGLAILQLIEDETLIDRAARLGEKLKKDLNLLGQKHQWIKEIRGKGLMIGIEFKEPESLSHKMKWKLLHKMNKGLFAEMIVMSLFTKHRILSQVSGHNQDIIKIIPPLIINEDQAGQFVSALDSVLSECNQIVGPIWSMGKNLMKHSLTNRNISS